MTKKFMTTVIISIYLLLSPVTIPDVMTIMHYAVSMGIYMYMYTLKHTYIYLYINFIFTKILDIATNIFLKWKTSFKGMEWKYHKFLSNLGQSDGSRGKASALLSLA